ncbi:CCE_0567 family metalloprotein, partial [Mesorhizobium sp.]|uniref:CCE_0567 family metalloprotein n=1 Tax=Mesorhizobium sp. TaxID=1871066 RepID=UPI00341EBA38
MRLQPLKPSPRWSASTKPLFQEGSMSDLDKMRKKVRKLQLRAAIAKMALQDLVEGLPGKWADIQEVAEKT